MSDVTSGGKGEAREGAPMIQNLRQEELPGFLRQINFTA